MDIIYFQSNSQGQDFLEIMRYNVFSKLEARQQEARPRCPSLLSLVAVVEQISEINRNVGRVNRLAFLYWRQKNIFCWSTTFIILPRAVENITQHKLWKSVFWPTSWIFHWVLKCSVWSKLGWNHDQSFSSTMQVLWCYWYYRILPQQQKLMIVVQICSGRSTCWPHF